MPDTEVTAADVAEQRAVVDDLRLKVAAARGDLVSNAAANNALAYEALVNEEDHLKEELARLTGVTANGEPYKTPEQDGVPIDVLPIAPGATTPTIPEGVTVLDASGHGAPLVDGALEAPLPESPQVPVITGLQGGVAPTPPADSSPAGPEIKVPDQGPSNDTPNGESDTPEGD